MTSFQKFTRIYAGIAVLVLNTALIGAIAIGVFFLTTRQRGKVQSENPIQKYGMSSLRNVYPTLSTDEIVILAKESYESPLIYAPYTHFTELPRTGRFVNVSEAGFRFVEDQGPWPPDAQNLNVFVFGGSTTFGYGVPDRETIPSALQRKLRSSANRVCVYNFGRGFHYSTQERILFSNLLAAGVVPDLVVFVDGLNDFYRLSDEPQFSGTYMTLVNQSFYERNHGSESVDPSKVVRKTSNRLSGKNEETARKICERYLRNKKVVEGMAKEHGVKTVFVWQPVPSYKFDLQFHPFAKSPSFGEHLFPAVGYRHMAQLRQTNAEVRNILWLADMQENAREQLYVDAVHYTGKMCDLIAEEIVRYIGEKDLLRR